MAQAEFEFWKIDSAFEPTAILAILSEKLADNVSDCIDKLPEKAKNFTYSVEQLNETFKNFGWADLIYAGNSVLSADELFTHLTEKGYTQKIKAIRQELLLPTIYFAYKVTELSQKQKETDIHLSSLTRDINISTLAHYLFLKGQRKRLTIYSSVLVTIIYSCAKDFQKRLVDTQAEIVGYQLIGGKQFSKHITEHMLEFVDITAESEIKIVTPTRLNYYKLNKAKIAKLSVLCDKLGIGIARKYDTYLEITSLYPFRIIKNYLGISGDLNESVIKQLASLLRQKLGLQKEPLKDAGTGQYEKPYAEFEFWKIDSAFEDAAIVAYLKEEHIQKLIDKLVTKATRVSYDPKKLDAAFRNFGWDEFLPIENKKKLNPLEVYTHCKQKIKEAYIKNNQTLDDKDSRFMFTNLVPAVYFIYKATELSTRQFELSGVQISSFSRNKRAERIEPTQIISNLFLIRKRHGESIENRVYPPVLTVLIYATEENFQDGLAEMQSKLEGYNMGAVKCDKYVSKGLCDFLDISTRKGTFGSSKGASDSFNIYYKTGELTQTELSLLQTSCNQLKINLLQKNAWGKKDYYLTVENTTPLRVAAAYFGMRTQIKKGMNRQIAGELLELLKEKRQSGKVLPWSREVVKERWLIPQDKTLRTVQVLNWFKAQERDKTPKEGANSRGEPEKPKVSKPSAKGIDTGDNVLLQRIRQHQQVEKAHKQPPEPEKPRQVYDFSKIKPLDDESKKKLLRLYCNGETITIRYLSEKDPALLEKVRQSLFTLPTMVIESDPMLKSGLDRIIYDFLKKIPEDKFEDNERYMKLLCRFSSENLGAHPNCKLLCDAVYMETKKEEVKRVYKHYFPNANLINKKKSA